MYLNTIFNHYFSNIGQFNSDKKHWQMENICNIIEKVTEVHKMSKKLYWIYFSKVIEISTTVFTLKNKIYNIETKNNKPILMVKKGNNSFQNGPIKILYQYALLHMVINNPACKVLTNSFLKCIRSCDQLLWQMDRTKALL